MSLGGFLDLGELVKRALKYFVEGLIVALAAYVIPSKRLRLDETLLIALVAAAIAGKRNTRKRYFTSNGT